MGLALDELEIESESTSEKDIKVVFDKTVKKLVEAGSSVVVDFKETPYGTGFVVDSGSHC